MNYLFDTNIISDLYITSSKQHLSIIEKFKSLASSDAIAISILTLYELEYAYGNAPLYNISNFCINSPIENSQ